MAPLVHALGVFALLGLAAAWVMALGWIVTGPGDGEPVERIPGDW